jgi:hypothetical protein
MLAAMAELCNTVASLELEAERRGEKLEIKALFEHAIGQGAFSDQELMRLWANFMLAALAARSLYRARAEKV